MLPVNDTERRVFAVRNMSAPNSPVKMPSNANSPHATPTKGGDRYVPFRQPTQNLITRFSAISQEEVVEARAPVKRTLGGSTRPNVHNNQPTATRELQFDSSSPSSNGYYIYNARAADTGADDTSNNVIVMKALLRNELLYDQIDDIRSYKPDQTEQIVQCAVPPPENPVRDSPVRALFHFGPKQTPTKHGDASTSSPSIFSGPLSEDSQRLLKSPRKPQRKVPKNPYKVLDAPELQDDFYLNLVDWSSQNMLSVGLNQCVYLWSACNSQVIKLCDLANDSDSVTSVQWTDKGDFLAVGTNKGITQIWDVHANKMVHEMPGHSSRIGCLAWNGDIICSGSRDRVIIQRDVRAPPGYSERRLTSHRQEVCGLKWSPDKQYLASGGNDNQLLVWSLRRPEPCQTYTEHNAAVKALAWSPHHHGLLVSGGGTADRCLRFWNTLTGQPMQCIDTGSQVCNVAWSKHSPELVSTHGYSYNQVVIWKYPSLQPVTKLAGHQTRVLYLAMSPDGESIVTGAGDETLRFWHVFCKSGVPKTARSRLNLIQSLR
ncbi:fzr-1 [Pristionchus pacificus]|uniref:Fizzy-related protein homolog n=1 Tax=Pristionchus pacificus TaxID=54126 RepID=A0A2A6B8D9_PRIPA|nr:fzr-1 [Pristionchus pacificus]|eukprot:PDM62135.1 fzr-1 [Pristionchus pacificus]